MKLLFACLFIAASASAATFSGSWLGEGTATGSQGFSAKCEIVKSDIQQTDKELILKSGGWECGEYKTEWTPSTIEIHNGNLWMHGHAVGTIDDKKIFARFPMAKPSRPTQPSWLMKPQ